MLEALFHLRCAAKTCMNNAGNVVKVVEYEDACVALYIRTIFMIRFFQNFLEEVVELQAQGEQRDLNKIFEDHLKKLEENNIRKYRLVLPGADEKCIKLN